MYVESLTIWYKISHGTRDFWCVATHLITIRQKENRVRKDDVIFTTQNIQEIRFGWQKSTIHEQKKLSDFTSAFILVFDFFLPRNYVTKT